MAKSNNKRPIRRNINNPDFSLPYQNPFTLPITNESKDLADKLGLNGLGIVGSNQPNSNTGGLGGLSAKSNDSVPTASELFSTLGMDDNWTKILQQFGKTGDFNKDLSQLGFHSGKNPDDAWAADWNKYLMEQMVNYLLTQENRQYNQGLLKDQRLYDNPLNQLARLMGAGISRDAAIALLSGGQGGSGSGVPYSDPAQSSQAIDPSQSHLNAVQAATGIAGAVFDGIGTLIGLTNLGLSVPQSLSQIDMLRNTQYLTNEQRSAYDSASTAYSIIQSSGADITADTFGNIGNITKSLVGLAQGGNDAAKQFISNGGLQRLRDTAPYSMPFISKMYKDNRESADYARTFDQQVRSMEAEIDIKQVQKDNLVQQGINMEQEFNNLIAQEDFTKQQATLCEKQAVYYEELAKSEPFKRSEYLAQAKSLRDQAALFRSSARLNNAGAWKQEQENDIFGAALELTDEYGNSGFSLSRDKLWNGLFIEAKKLAKIKDQKLWRKEIAALLSDYDMRIAVCGLQQLYADGSLQALANTGEDMKDMIYLARVLDECGVNDFINSESTSSHVDLPNIASYNVRTETSEKVSKRLHRGAKRKWKWQQ